MILKFEHQGSLQQYGLYPRRRAVGSCRCQHCHSCSTVWSSCTICSVHAMCIFSGCCRIRKFEHQSSLQQYGLHRLKPVFGHSFALRQHGILLDMCAPCACRAIVVAMLHTSAQARFCRGIPLLQSSLRHVFNSSPCVGERQCGVCTFLVI